MKTTHPLEPLDINTQKDEIIARLILQKCAMYVRCTEKWLDGWLSKKELDHVIIYSRIRSYSFC